MWLTALHDSHRLSTFFFFNFTSDYAAMRRNFKLVEWSRLAVLHKSFSVVKDMACGLSAVHCMPQSDRNEPFVRIAVSGGVYMGKLAPARVSYRDDFVISYRFVRLHDDWVFSSSHVQRVEADEAILD